MHNVAKWAGTLYKSVPDHFGTLCIKWLISFWVLFHRHRRFMEQQEKGGTFSVVLLCFHSLTKARPYGSKSFDYH